MLPLTLEQACHLRAHLIAKKYSSGLNAMQAALLNKLDEQITPEIAKKFPLPNLEDLLIEDSMKEMGFHE